MFQVDESATVYDQHSRDEIVSSTQRAGFIFEYCCLLHAKSGQLTFTATAGSTPDVILIWRHHLPSLASTVREYVRPTPFGREVAIRSSDPSIKIGVTREWSRLKSSNG